MFEMAAPTRRVQAALLAVASARRIVQYTFNARAYAAAHLIALGPQRLDHAQHVRRINLLYRHLTNHGQHIISESLPPRFRRSPVPQAGLQRINALLGYLCECLYSLALARVYAISKQPSLLCRALARIAQ